MPRTSASKPSTPAPPLTSQARPNLPNSATNPTFIPDDSNDNEFPIDDPITNEFDVFITPSHDPLESLYLLQFPTRQRTRPYNGSANFAPTGMRVKPESGFMELDIPIHMDQTYDHAKAKDWADALHKTGGGEGLGLSGGFVGKRGLAARLKRDDDDSEIPDGEGIQKQTLGGLINREEDAGPQYMIGAFKGDQLHLTPINGRVQLRPQHPHIDASAQLARQAQAQHQRATGPQPTLSRPTPAPRPTTTTNIVALRAADDPYAATRSLISAAAEEGWRHLRCVDEEEDEAYHVYQGLFFGDETGTGERRQQLRGVSGKEAFLDRLCEGLGGDEKGRRRARGRRRRKVAVREGEKEKVSGGEGEAVGAAAAAEDEDAVAGRKHGGGGAA